MAANPNVYCDEPLFSKHLTDEMTRINLLEAVALERMHMNAVTTDSSDNIYLLENPESESGVDKIWGDTNPLRVNKFNSSLVYQSSSTIYDHLFAGITSDGTNLYVIDPDDGDGEALVKLNSSMTDIASVDPTIDVVHSGATGFKWRGLAFGAGHVYVLMRWITGATDVWTGVAQFDTGLNLEDWERIEVAVENEEWTKVTANASQLYFTDEINDDIHRYDHSLISVDSIAITAPIDASDIYIGFTANNNNLFLFYWDDSESTYKIQKTDSDLTNRGTVASIAVGTGDGDISTPNEPPPEPTFGLENVYFGFHADTSGGINYLWVGDSANGRAQRLILATGAHSATFSKAFTGGQTEWFAYTTDTTKTSIGTQPADDDLTDNGGKIYAENIVRMRDAVETLVFQANFLKIDDLHYSWFDPVAEPNNPDIQLYNDALGDRTKYGATGGAQNDWTRNQVTLEGDPIYDIDIGELFECMEAMEAADN